MPNDNYDTSNGTNSTTPTSAHALGLPADWPRHQQQHQAHHQPHHHHLHHRHSGDPSAIASISAAHSTPAPTSRQQHQQHQQHPQSHQPSYHNLHQHHSFASASASASYGPGPYTHPFGQFGFLPTTQPPLQRSHHHPQWPISDPGAINFQVSAPAVTQAPSAAAYHQLLLPQDDQDVLNRARPGVRGSSSPLSSGPTTSYPNPAVHHHGPSAGRRTSGSPIRIKGPSISPKQEHNPASIFTTTAGGPVRSSAQDTGSPTRSKKRSRGETEDESKEQIKEEPAKKAKPQRGRPRLTGVGETPNERRRKQIREAQRAYRNRKDQAITDLEEKVKKLQEDNNVITQEFSGFLGLLQTQGTSHANPEFLQRFHDLSLKYAPSTVGRQGRRESDEHSAPSSTAGREKASAQRQHRRQTLQTASSTSSDRYTPLPSAAQARPSVQGVPNSFASSSTSFYPPESMSYEIIAQATPENASFPSYAPDPQAPGGWVEQPPIHQSFMGPGAQSSVAYTRPPPTFGRRLHLETLKRGLTLASMSAPPLERFGAVFGFCLLYETREAIINRLNEQIRAVSQAPMDNWEDVFPHSHRYNKRITQFPGYDGDAFIDSEAVGEYLLERGIHVPGTAEFVEVEFDPREFGGSVETRAVPTSAPPVSCSQAASQIQQLPGMSHTPVSNMWFSQPGQTAGATSTADTIVAMFADGPAVTAADTSALNSFLYPAVPSGSWVSQAPLRVKTTLNVSVLMDEIMKRSVCLGKTPGLRPKDVDRAVRIATGLSPRE